MNDFFSILSLNFPPQNNFPVVESKLLLSSSIIKDHHHSSSFSQKIESSIDYKQQKFIVEIPKNTNFSPLILDIIEYDESKPQNSYFNRQIIPKFEFILEGISSIILDSPCLENHSFLEKNSHTYIIKKGEKLFEMMFLKYEKNSEDLNNFLFLLCLQKEEKFNVFPIIELCFWKKNQFNLPFMEPHEFFIMLAEPKERVNLLDYLENKPSDILYVLKELVEIIEEFVKKNLVFSGINFQNFVIIIDSFKIRNMNPENVLLFQGDFEKLVEELKINELQRGSFALYKELIKEKIESLEDLYKYEYFCLMICYFKLKKYDKISEFHQYFKRYYYPSKEIEEKTEAEEVFLFSLLKEKIPSENTSKTSIITLSKEEVEILNKTIFFPKEFPKTLIFSQEFDQIWLQTSLEFLSILIIFGKFDESLLLIQKLSLLNLDILTKTLLIEKKGFIYLNNEDMEKGLVILNNGLSDILNIYGTNSNEISCKLYHLISFYHIKQNRFFEAIQFLETAYKFIKHHKDKTVYFNITYALGHLYKENNKMEKSFSCFSKLHDYIFDIFPQCSLIRRTYCEVLGILYIQRHEYSIAKDLLEKALEIYRLRCENIDKNEKYSNILNSLGMCFFELRNPKKALLYYEKSIEIKGNLFSQNFEDKGDALNNLALIYAELGDNKKAIEMNLKAIDIYKQKKENINLANSLNNLGLAYKSSSEYDKAIETMLQSLSLFEEFYEKNHLQIGKILNNIGMTYFDKGEWVKAIEYCERTLEIYQHQEDLQSIGRCLNNLGILYSGNLDYEKAIEYYDKALKIKNEVENINHIDIADTKNNLATVYYLLLKFDLAAKHFQSVLDIRKKYLGDFHKNTIETYLNIGNSCYNCKEFKEANGFLRKWKELYIKDKEDLEKSHEFAVNIYKIGICESRLGNYEESLEFFAKAVKIERNLQEDKKNLGIFLRDYGFALMQQKKYEESLETLKESLEILKKLYKKTDPEIMALKYDVKKVRGYLKIKNKNK